MVFDKILLADFALEEEDEDSLADIVSKAFSNGVVAAAVADMENEVSRQNTLVEALRERFPTQSGIEVTLASIRALEAVEKDASLRKSKILTSSSTAAPLADRAGPLIEKEKRLKQAAVYARLMAAIADGNRPLKELVQLAGPFKTVNKELHIMQLCGEAVSARVKQKKTEIETELNGFLKKMNFPITAAQPELHDEAVDMSHFQVCLQRMNELQETYEEFKGQNQQSLWSVATLMAPFKVRFRYHFSGNRSTNRIDKPEWYHLFMLEAIRDHLNFLIKNVQPACEGQDVVKHFIRYLVKLLHSHFQRIWPSLSKSPALICKTVDESIELDSKFRMNFLYPPIEVSCVAWFAENPQRLLQWFRADLHFGSKRLEEIFATDKAWETFQDLIDGFASNAATKSGEALQVTKCADQVAMLLKSISSRCDFVKSEMVRTALIEFVVLPLVDAFALLMAKNFEMSEFDKWSRIWQIINTLFHVKAGLVKRSVRLPILTTVKYRLLNTSEATEILRSEIGTSESTDEFLQNTLGKIELQKGEMKEILQAGAELLETREEEQVEKIATHLFIDFVRRSSSFIKACKRGRYSDEVTFASGGSAHVSLLGALERLEEILLQAKANLNRPSCESVVKLLASRISMHLQTHVFDACKFTESGADLCERDLSVLYLSFASFTKKPENRFFRNLKERANLLSSSAHNLKSFANALRALMTNWDGRRDSPVGREITRMLEDGHEISTMSAEDVLVLIASRRDL